MGLFETIFKGRIDKAARAYFSTLTAYAPVFTSYEGSLYEMELTRSAVHAFATACSKLKPEMSGTAYKTLEKTLQFRPNPLMNTSQFIYRIATIFSVCNNAFIVPIEDSNGYITGYFPVMPNLCEVLEVDGVPFLRYTFSNGQRAAIEYHKAGLLTQYQYKDDIFGESNEPLKPTMDLIHTQNQGIINGVKNSAAIRFMGKLTQAMKREDIAKERQRFTEENLSANNTSGLILYDQKYSEIKQIESKPFIVNPVQMKQINENVFNYFGVSESILQNKFTEDEWNAFYEGKIEPFALQLSLVMSSMTFTPRELSFGNSITFTSNRLQYASNKTKIGISTQLFDRGILSYNQIADIWNLPHDPSPEGDKRFLRKEYAEVGTPAETGGAEAGEQIDYTAVQESRAAKKDIIAVDFDGTLVENLFPKIGKMNKKVFEFIKEKRKAGNTIILWTCRKDKELAAAVQFCKDNGLEFDYVNENTAESIKALGGDTRKIYATSYIDDRNVTLKEIEG